MTINFAHVQRSLIAAVGAVLISTIMLSAAVLPSVAPLTSQPAL